jgi:hypothetical protein
MKQEGQPTAQPHSFAEKKARMSERLPKRSRSAVLLQYPSCAQVGGVFTNKALTQVPGIYKRHQVLYVRHYAKAINQSKVTRVRETCDLIVLRKTIWKSMAVSDLYIQSPSLLHPSSETLPATYTAPR